METREQNSSHVLPGLGLLRGTGATAWLLFAIGLEHRNASWDVLLALQCGHVERTPERRTALNPPQCSLTLAEHVSRASKTPHFLPIMSNHFRMDELKGIIAHVPLSL